jgi:hypothetical protein
VILWTPSSAANLVWVRPSRARSRRTAFGGHGTMFGSWV